MPHTSTSTMRLTQTSGCQLPPSRVVNAYRSPSAVNPFFTTALSRTYRPSS